ncbi:unnamed protein product, partial [Diamesa serratosioi]
IGDIMKCHPVLAAIWEDHKDFIMVFLRRIADITMISDDIKKWQSNSSELLAARPRNNFLVFNSVQKLVASGCFMFFALFNHSCIPNVKKGDKLTISYE